jgi:hypothetical protein
VGPVGISPPDAFKNRNLDSSAVSADGSAEITQIPTPAGRTDSERKFVEQSVPANVATSLTTVTYPESLPILPKKNTDAPVSTTVPVNQNTEVAGNLALQSSQTTVDKLTKQRRGGILSNNESHDDNDDRGEFPYLNLVELGSSSRAGQVSPPGLAESQNQQDTKPAGTETSNANPNKSKVSPRTKRRIITQKQNQNKKTLEGSTNMTDANDVVTSKGDVKPEILTENELSQKFEASSYVSPIIKSYTQDAKRLTGGSRPTTRKKKKPKKKSKSKRKKTRKNTHKK